MKQFILASVLSLTLSPATLVAEEAVPLPDDETLEEGFNLMEEGARIFLRGLMSEMEPKLDELQGLTDDMSAAMSEFADAMGPAMADLMAKIDDMRNYDAPEVLPNGDIIIRRSPDAPVYVPNTQTGEIDI